MSIYFIYIPSPIIEVKILYTLPCNTLFINVTPLPLFINAIAPLINTLNIQLIETKVTTINYSRDLVTLAKIYTEESKYSKENNNFSYKLMIFNNLYDRVNIL